PQDQCSQEKQDEVWQRRLELREVERNEAPDEEVHEGPVDDLQDPGEAPLVEVQVAAQQRGDTMEFHERLMPAARSARASETRLPNRPRRRRPWSPRPSPPPRSGPAGGR